MSKLRLAPDLILPDDVVTATAVVYGGKGMGKTNFGSVLVEELTKAQLRWCVLDPMGVWWGLRHSKDGKGPGIECVILGGAHGDIPIEPTGGAIVADLVVDENANVIIDFSRKADGHMWTLGEKVRFVTEYTLRLFQRQGELVDKRRREPMMQILDEAARYIPQTIPHGSEQLARCVGAWEQVCEEGRNIGLGVAFLTQRSARMNKSVSELADVMVAFRTIGPNSLAAILDWLGEHVDKARSKDLSAQVRELNVGQALVVSPGWLRLEKVVKIRERETFDSSATPKPGQRAQRVSGPAAKPDLAKYEQKMAATIEKAKADDPKELRKRITELERDVKKTSPAPPPTSLADPRAVDRAVKDATRALTAQLMSARKTLEAAMKFLITISTANFDTAGVDKEELQRAVGEAVARAAELVDRRLSTREKELNRLKESAVSIAQRVQDILENSDVEIAVEVTKNEPFTVAAPMRSPAPRAVRAAPVDGAIGKTPQRMLNALLFLETVGTSPASRQAVAGLCSVSWDTGSFRNNVSELRTNGFVTDAPDGGLALTDAGRAQASDEGLPTTTDELHAAWLSKLSGTTAKMFRIILDAYPKGVSREAIAEQLGLSWDTGSFRNNLSEMRSPGLIVDESRTHVRAADALFPKGLR